MEFTKEISFSSDPQVDGVLSVTYNGFLNNSSDVWIVYGYNQSWEHTTELKMNKSENGFTANIEILDFSTFNFCFKNSENQWDNNNNCNYISSIRPSYNSQLIALFDELFSDNNLFQDELPIEKEDISECVEEPAKAEFDIDQLIEEILQPLTIQTSTEEKVTIEKPEILENSLDDLDNEISTLLSEISVPEVQSPLSESERASLLSANIVSEEPIDIVEETNDKVSYIENTNDVESTNELVKETDETLSTLVDSKFAISPRKLNKFYLFKKRVKLFFYKAFYKLPEVLFGTNDDQ